MAKTKVIHKKLGRQQADGLAFAEHKEIHIDERLKSKDYFLTAIHELLHIHQPNMSEKQVISLSTKLCNDLWEMKFRKVDE